jgi:hypothetical protein
MIREPGKICILTHRRHGEEQGFQGDARFRGQQGLAENLPMLRFHRTPMLRGTELEPMDDLWVNVSDDELCHVMLLLPGKSVIDDINDITVRSALREQDTVQTAS